MLYLFPLWVFIVHINIYGLSIKLRVNAQLAPIGQSTVKCDCELW